MAPNPKNTPEQEVKTETPQVEMVQIPKAQLDTLMDLVPKVEKLQEDNKALAFAADRAKIEIFNERQQAPGNKTVKLRTYIGEDGIRKVVLLWIKLRDDVYKATNGAWVEDQIMELILEDDSKVQLSYKEFSTNTADKIKVEVVEERGNTLKVRTIDSKEYLIDKDFVN